MIVETTLYVLSAVAVTAGVAAGVLKVSRNKIKRELKIDTPNGIQISEKVMIGGIPQWIQIRGEDRGNPILFFLHGGPGGDQSDTFLPEGMGKAFHRRQLGPARLRQNAVRVGCGGSEEDHYDGAHDRRRMRGREIHSQAHRAGSHRCPRPELGQRARLAARVEIPGALLRVYRHRTGRRHHKEFSARL